MYSKQNFLFAIFIAMIGLIVSLPFLHCNKYSSANYHEFLKSDEFKKLKRSEQIIKCGSCHKQEYENEIRGPHANAYQKLLEHRDFVNSNLYQCDFYTREVNKSFENCTGCHSPQNLYQTFLFDSINNPTTFVSKLLAILHPRPLARIDTMERISGVDCFSCHFDGNKILSLKHIKSSNDSIVKFQTLEVITQNNLVCYPCHFDVIKTINPEMAIKRTGSVLCVNCHQERDQTGKKNHYYYWQHDAPEKINSKLISLIDDFHFTILPNQKTGEISWLNTTIPHKISPGPEMIMKCEVFDTKSNLIGTKTIWINKKKEFDKEMYESLGKNTLFGVEGIDAPLDNKPIKYSIALKEVTKAKFFKISLTHKSQYWFPDSLGVLTAVKIYSIDK